MPWEMVGVSKRAWWTLAFLGTTLLAVAGELWAAFDRSDNTVPWTDYITSLPIWAWLPLTAVLVIWLPIHLWTRWWQRRKERT